MMGTGKSMDENERWLRSGYWALVVILLGLAWTLPAIAQEAPDLEAEARRAQARAHLEMGRQALEAGDHAEALSQLQRSFELSPDPELRFDLGRCHLELGQRDEARRQLELYLAEVDPGLITAERRQEVEAMLASMEEETPPPELSPEEASAEPPPHQPIEPAPTSRRRLSPAWFWSSLGLAAALAIGGAVTGGLVMRAGDEYDQLRDDYIGGDADAYGEGMDTRERAESLATVTNVLFPVAGVFAAAALVLAFFTDFGGDGESASALRLTAGPEQVGLWGRF